MTTEPVPTPEPEAPRGFWEHLVGFFLDNTLVTMLLGALLIIASVIVAPFDLGGGLLPRDPVPVDAIPDIGENQQIVFTEWPGRSPQDIEDQVTYPLTTTLLGTPGVKTVRSFSMLGFSTVYVIFDEDMPFYDSRSRLLEKLSALPPGSLPEDVRPILGPDATALGQVFWYTLEGRDPEGRPTGGWDLHELRSAQDWNVRFALQSVPGVAEVASVGGHALEYQIDVNPEALIAHDLTLPQVADAVRNTNLDIGARTLEINRVEYVIRSLGFVEDLQDLEDTVIVARDGAPLRVRDVATVTTGPANRRGVLDDSGAEAVGGVVVARFGENPLEVIDRVKLQIAEIAPGLPRKTLEDGTTSQLTVVPFYDRTQLIHETLGTLSTALLQQLLITILVVIVLLRRLRPSILISAMVPMAVLTSFLLMKLGGIGANIMSLAGIAIAIGTMVDQGIVFTENIVLHLDAAAPGADRRGIVRRAAAEVTPAVLTSTLTTVFSFLPVFALTEAEGKLFTPLAWAKTFALTGSLIFSVALLPSLALLLLWPKPRPLDNALPLGRRVLRSLLRPAHLRDAAVLLLGLAVVVLGSPWGWAFVAFALLRFVEPLLPARLRKLPSALENVAAAGLAFVFLTTSWMPLGHARGLPVNLLLVGGCVGLLLGIFLLFERAYGALLRWMLDHKGLALLLPALLITFGLTAWRGFDTTFGWLPEPARQTQVATRLAHALPGFGREFMPPFDEGAFLYMPTTMPHASLGQAMELLQDTDRAIAAVPEIDRVVGKLGRADSPLDPAPVSMIETIILYKPEYITDKEGNRIRQWRDTIRSPEDIWQAILAAADRPGLTSAPELMPINARIVMLQSGMRSAMGVKVRAPDLATLEAASLQLEATLKEVPALIPGSVFAERVVGKPYLEIDLDRDAIARYGLRVNDVQRVLQVALGGVTLTRSVEGRERYPIRVRLAREERDSPEALQALLIPTPAGPSVPLSALAELRYVRGPQMIKAEDTALTAYITFDRQHDIPEVNAVEQAQQLLQQRLTSGQLKLPPGVTWSFAGSYQNQLRSEQRLLLLIPLALTLIFIILYLQFKRTSTAAIIFTGVAVAASGGFLLIWLYGQPGFLDVEVLGMNLRELFQVGPVNLSVAVWVGFIALLGVATDDGVVMATFIQQRFQQTTPHTTAEVRAHILDAGQRRVRACLMTTATTVLALLPVVTSNGRGADVMIPMALPSLGGMTIELITLFVVPVLYCAQEELRVMWRAWRANAPETML